MKASDFVKWTSSEKGEEFSHVGRLESINDKWVKLQTSRGLFEFRRTDGTLEAHEEVDLTPVASFEPNEIQAAPSAPKEKKEKVVRQRPEKGEPSKQDRAVEIVRKHLGSSRKELIDLIIKELGMTPAGASTYVHNAKKILEKESTSK